MAEQRVAQRRRRRTGFEAGSPQSCGYLHHIGWQTQGRHQRLPAVRANGCETGADRVNSCELTAASWQPSALTLAADSYPASTDPPLTFKISP